MGNWFLRRRLLGLLQWQILRLRTSHHFARMKSSAIHRRIHRRLSNVSPCPVEGPPPPSSHDCKPGATNVRRSDWGDDACSKTRLGFLCKKMTSLTYLNITVEMSIENTSSMPYDLEDMAKKSHSARCPERSLPGPAGPQAPLEACYVPTMHPTAAESSCRNRCDTGPADTALHSF